MVFDFCTDNSVPLFQGRNIFSRKDDAPASCRKTECPSCGIGPAGSTRQTRHTGNRAAPFSFYRPSRFLSSPGYREIGERKHRDLTKVAKFSLQDDKLVVDAQGYISPIKEGETRLKIQAGGLETEVPVSIKSLAKSRPVDFVRDIAPIVNKAGCTSGPCHGAAKGKTDSNFPCGVTIRNLILKCWFTMCRAGV